MTALTAFALALAYALLRGATFAYVAGFVTASALWLPYTWMLQSTGVAHRQAGIEAERWTAQELRGLRRWFVVNHVTLDYGDVDHAIGGPGGFFAIETKFRSDWQATRGDLSDMARIASDRARKLGLRMGFRDGRVRPLIVVWGSDAKTLFPSRTSIAGVDVVHGSALRSFLRELPVVASDAEITEAFAALDQYVRKVDAGDIKRHGAVPRPAADVVSELLKLTGAALVTVFVVLLPVRLAPAGIWSMAIASAVAVVALVQRRRIRSRGGSGYLATATVTAAAASDVVVGALVVVSHLG